MVRIGVTFSSHLSNIKILPQTTMKPSSNDVLKGRGVPIQNHPGNQFFRRVVASRRPQYTIITKIKDKEAIANHILYAIQSQTPPGRFLEPTGTKDEYKLMSQESVMKKIKQALRETPKRRKTRTTCGSNDEPTEYGAIKMTKRKILLLVLRNHQHQPPKNLHLRVLMNGTRNHKPNNTKMTSNDMTKKT